MKYTPHQIIQQLSTIVDASLAQAAVESYVDMQQRFLAGDWGPSELNGGKLSEAVSRCLLQLDTGRIDHRKLPGKVRDDLLDKSLTHTLKFVDRLHIAKVIDVVYKFRSDRGAVHISTTYTANFMDSMLVLHSGKWMLAELLRLALKKDRETVGEIIEQLVQLEHSLIHELDGKPLVMVKKISAPHEVLVLLHHAVSNRLTRSQLREYATGQSSQNVNVAISRLIAEKDIRPVDDDVVTLTPKGQQRVITEIMPLLNQRR